MARDEHVNDVLQGLRTAGASGLATLNPAEVASAAAADPDGFARALRPYARQATPGVGDKALHARAIRDFLDAVCRHLDEASPHADYLRALARVHQAIEDDKLRSEIIAFRSSRLIQCVESRTDAEVFSTPGGRIALEHTLGKICSLDDRDRAHAHFQKAREADSHRLPRFFYVDMGAMTYFDRNQIEQDGNTQHIENIIEGIRPYGEVSSSNALAFGMSMDERFYRIYSPLIMFYAQQVPDVDFNILLCMNRGQAKEVITDSRRYLTALNVLNRSGKPKNVHHYYTEPPRWAAEKRTFYACARFFFAPLLLEKHRSVYLMDADLTMDNHPTPILNKLKKLPVAIPHTKGEAALSPWRRFMAGNIALNQDILDTDFLGDLLAYMTAGLRSKSSWMLDQNAFSYAVERHTASVPNINEIGRPFRAQQFMTTWEKNFAG